MVVLEHTYWERIGIDADGAPSVCETANISHGCSAGSRAACCAIVWKKRTLLRDACVVILHMCVEVKAVMEEVGVLDCLP